MAPATQRCAVLVPHAFRSIVERLCSFILTYGGSGAPSSSFISLYLLIRYDALHVSDDPLLFTPPVMGGNVLSRPFTILIINKIHHSHHSVPLLRISSSPVSQHLSVLVSCTAQRIEKDSENALTSIRVTHGSAQGCFGHSLRYRRARALPHAALVRAGLADGARSLGPWHPSVSTHMLRAQLPKHVRCSPYAATHTATSISSAERPHAR